LTSVDLSAMLHASTLIDTKVGATMEHTILDLAAIRLADLRREAAAERLAAQFPTTRPWAARVASLRERLAPRPSQSAVCCA
jgi:hypothetical protein